MTSNPIPATLNASDLVALAFDMAVELFIEESANVSWVHADDANPDEAIPHAMSMLRAVLSADQPDAAALVLAEAKARIEANRW